jgi:hypothetical protein
MILLSGVGWLQNWMSLGLRWTMYRGFCGMNNMKAQRKHYLTYRIEMKWQVKRIWCCIVGTLCQWHGPGRLRALLPGSWFKKSLSVVEVVSLARRNRQE